MLYICLERICHVVEEDCSDEHPHFQVFERFNDLIRLVMNIFHTSLVGLKTLNCNDALTLGEKACRMWRIWEDPP